jgi:hypothetical protein
MVHVGKNLYAQFHTQLRKATSENYEMLKIPFRAHVFSCSKTSDLG